MFALINERSLSRDSGSQFTIESSATCPGRTAETRPCKLSRRDLRSFSLIASTLIVWPSKDNDRACKSISKSLISIQSSGISKPRYFNTSWGVIRAILIILLTSICEQFYLYIRSEERRVGYECVSKCSYWWMPYQ